MLQSITALLLSLLQCVLALFGFTGPIQEPAPKDTYPIVFVHGLAGWGEDADLNYIVPHWGQMAGSLPKYLNSQGYECYAASVGPVSSAWDRACELYAHITGSRVDYGAAHAAEYGHERYGLTYKKALLPDWNDSDRKIHLVGHSFGGMTARLFIQLLEEGSAAERAVTPEEALSPLFSGALGGRVASLTTLGAPHNGSTAPEPGIDASAKLHTMLTALGYVVNIIPFASRVYPYRLEHFGISFANLIRTPWKAVETERAFNEGRDRAEVDLTVDTSAALNEGLSCLPEIYYFSYAAQRTRDDGNGNQVPHEDMWSMFQEGAALMGLRRKPFYTAGGVLIDDAWLPNDGLVNVISALYPFNEPRQDYDPDDLRPGVWQVMPLIEEYDHMDFVGGMRQLGGTPGIQEFYLELANMLEMVP